MWSRRPGTDTVLTETFYAFLLTYRNHGNGLSESREIFGLTVFVLLFKLILLRKSRKTKSSVAAERQRASVAAERQRASVTAERQRAGVAAERQSDTPENHRSIAVHHIP